MPAGRAEAADPWRPRPGYEPESKTQTWRLARIFRTEGTPPNFRLERCRQVRGPHPAGPGDPSTPFRRVPDCAVKGAVGCGTGPAAGAGLGNVDTWTPGDRSRKADHALRRVPWAGEALLWCVGAVHGYSQHSFIHSFSVETEKDLTLGDRGRACGHRQRSVQRSWGLGCPEPNPMLCMEIT